MHLAALIVDSQPDSAGYSAKSKAHASAFLKLPIWRERSGLEFRPVMGTLA